MANLNANTRMFYTRPSDGAAYCFEPVPLLAESNEFLKTIDNRLGTIHKLTFNGYLLPERPALSGVSAEASCLELLDRKSYQLKSALSEDFGDLLIVDQSGYPVEVAKPRVVSIDFDESQIVNHRKYSVVFEYESGFDSDRKVREYSENWSFNQQEDDTISATHTLNAVGFSEPSASRTAIENARIFVLTRIGFSASQSVLIQTPYVDAFVSVDTLGRFNHVLTESSDITTGSYNAVETWILASGNYKDDRTVEHSFELEGEALVETVSINGTVQGYGDTTFDKFQNAVNGFNNVVVGEIDFNATSGVASKSKTENRFAGTIAYSMTTSPSGDDIRGRSISRSIDRQEDGSVVQTVTTSASVKPGSTATIDSASAFCFANNYPIDSATPIFSAALSGNVQSVNTTRDDIERSFSLTQVFVDQSTALWTETYEVSREEQVDSSTTSISINGTVQGYGVETGTKSSVRFTSASGAYYDTVAGLIAERISEVIPSGSCLSDDATSNSFGFNKFTGTITYSQTFNNRFLTNNANILDEKISVSFVLAGDVVVVMQIPGKADGPVIQDQETVTGLSKSLSIEYTMAASSSGCATGEVIVSNSILDIAIAESNVLINNTPAQNIRGEKPALSAVFKTSDVIGGFDRQTNKFTRNVTWLYL